MALFNFGKAAWKPFWSHIFFRPAPQPELHVLENVPSAALRRPVKVRLLLPPGYYETDRLYPSLYLNDGQDLEALRLQERLAKLYQKQAIAPFVLIALHAEEDRMQEYGTAGKPDYKKRGKKAGAYTRFVSEELLPLLQRRYRLLKGAEHRAVAGFSLGGLSAFDIAWNRPEYFSRVGVFSGSLWWRDRAFDPQRPDANRIVHKMVERGPKRSGLKFWLQAGTKDETADRNNNGIIDAIDDTLGLIEALKRQGYREGADIRYREVSGGRHNPQTWGKVLPDFLRWAFPPLVQKATNE